MTGHINIGRQTVTEDGVIPNDITLSISDLAISRVHCRIIYQDGFKHMPRVVSPQWLEFSKIFTRLRPLKVRYLPIGVQRIILSYLREPRNFYIQDLGSIHGTYI